MTCTGSYRGPTSLGTKTSPTDTVVSCRAVAFMSGLDSAKVKNSVVSAAFIYGRRAAAESDVRGKGAPLGQVSKRCVWGVLRSLRRRSQKSAKDIRCLPLLRLRGCWLVLALASSTGVTPSPQQAWQGLPGIAQVTGEGEGTPPQRTSKGPEHI